jgi:hypothetical protein
MLQHVLVLAVGHLQEARSFLACAAYAPTYIVEILHMINVIGMKINYHNP